MKVVLNKYYGGYGCGVEEKFEDLVNKYEHDRFNLELVNFVENNPEDCGDLEVVEIPDNYTDYDIQEYDGWETLIYVINGLIHYA